MSVLNSLSTFRGLIKSHIGSDITAKSDPLLSNVLDHFDSVLSNGGNTDNTIEAAKRNESTDWGLLLQDTVDFLHGHKGLIQDVQSQNLRIDQDIKVLLDVIQTKAANGGVNDNEYLMERLIQLAISLPDGSKAQSKLTGTLLKELWDSLLHPPSSYLGDDYEYRTADGSNNNVFYPKLGMAGSAYAKSVTPMTTGRPYPDPGEVFDSTRSRSRNQ
jgi:hypothetical protein